MFVVHGWFGGTPVGREDGDAELAGLAPAGVVRHDFGGCGWHVTVCRLADPGDYRWPAYVTDGRVTAISIGIPVGVAGAAPVEMARRLLDGADVHAGVVPPFGLVAIDGDRVVVQQDWLGMCRLFTGCAGGVTVFGNRPSLVGRLLHGAVTPSGDGWGSYAVTGAFGGDLSPVRGVTLMPPGQRLTATGAAITRERRYSVDDVVAAGLAGRPESVLDGAAAGVRRAVESIDDLWAGPVTLGLSGGKDSRVIAAAFVAAGRVPRFTTNNDTPAEGTTAKALTDLLRVRGLDVDHRIAPASAPGRVLAVGLRERAERLQRHYDFQFPSSYLIRPAVTPHLPAAARPLSVTGVGGEMSTAYWYPAGSDDGSRPVLAREVDARLMQAVAPAAVDPDVRERERARLHGVLDHAAELGLSGLAQLDYVYLVERVRRWATSAYHVGMVTPLLAPEALAATFAMSPADKRDRRLHLGLLRRFVPEWAAVPFVSIGTGRSTVTRIWDGDGPRVMADLLAGTSDAGILGILRRPAIEAALAGRSTAHRRLAEQFTTLAVASRTLDPSAVRASWKPVWARRSRLGARA